MNIAVAPLPQFLPYALNFFEAHAISPDVAVGAGVVQRGMSLLYPVATADGTFKRTRRLDEEGRTFQPRGVPLAAWWPLGRPQLCPIAFAVEGESDALAACSALARTPVSGLAEFAVCSLPGTSFPLGRLVEELVRVECAFAYLAFDGDEAGRKLTRRAESTLIAAGIRTADLGIRDGDLSGLLAVEAPKDRGKRFAEMLLDVEAGSR
jgi:Toprim-like